MGREMAFLPKRAVVFTACVALAAVAYAADFTPSSSGELNDSAVASPKTSLVGTSDGDSKELAELGEGKEKDDEEDEPAKKKKKKKDEEDEPAVKWTMPAKEKDVKAKLTALAQKPVFKDKGENPLKMTVPQLLAKEKGIKEKIKAAQKGSKKAATKDDESAKKDDEEDEPAKKDDEEDEPAKKEDKA